MAHLTESIAKECKKRLLEAKMDILNRVKVGREVLSSQEASSTGDEADQTARLMQESEFISNQERLRGQLTEIEFALSRLENGTYGICEETEELIEVDRLLAIPWTRLSIEGAEIREAMGRRYAKG